jgi:hypothetical protein
VVGDEPIFRHMTRCGTVSQGYEPLPMWSKDCTEVVKIDENHENTQEIDENPKRIGRKPGKWPENRRRIDQKPEFQMPHAALCRLTLLTAKYKLTAKKKLMKIEEEVKGERGARFARIREI